RGHRTQKHQRTITTNAIDLIMYGAATAPASKATERAHHATASVPRPARQSTPGPGAGRRCRGAFRQRVRRLSDGRAGSGNDAAGVSDRVRAGAGGRPPIADGAPGEGNAELTEHEH